ncbi:MAG: hypothetical protein WAQ08_16025 [Aquabacterium sp.]|uniref:hypothetical protein n=1 Tax=Aquabacterium sp. TaxID=1872578 RepID=UPI003BB003D3
MKGCALCGSPHHERSSCPWAKRVIPSARIRIEPYDGHDRMVACRDCHRRFKCRLYVPHNAHLLQHCSAFTPTT